MFNFKHIIKKKCPEYHRITVTNDRFSGKGIGIIDLVELYFKKYGFYYVEIDDKDKHYMERFHSYIIEIKYKDRDYIETLLNRVFKYNPENHMTLSAYERWLKTERLRRKILNI
jgi:hypothetical protein